jgi:phage portal protein BeeE
VRYLDSAELKELQQIRNFSTRDNSLGRGQSPLVSASKEVRQHILGGVHNVSLLERGGRLSLVFHFEDDLDEDDFNETQDRVHQNYSGADQAGKVAVTAGPHLTINELGNSNKDMDFANLQKLIRDVISQVYHVPLPLVSTDAATFSNYSSAKTALYDDAVSPLAGRLYAGLGELLLPRYGLDPSEVAITFDPDLIPALKMRRNEELVLRRGVNIESTNELRGSVGLEDVEGGDDILVNSALVPLGEDAFGDDTDDIPVPPVVVAPVDPDAPVPPEQPEDPEDPEEPEDEV